LADTAISQSISRLDGIEKMPEKFCSNALPATHKTMEALHVVGAINKQTMREFGEACLTPAHALSTEEIKTLRLHEHISRRFLRVTSPKSSRYSTRSHRAGRDMSNIERLYVNAPVLRGRRVFPGKAGAKLTKNRRGDSSGARGAARL
jgi:putative transcriptional regulator